MINQPMILSITFIFDTFLTNWLPCGIGNYRNNYFFCMLLHNKYTQKYLKKLLYNNKWKNYKRKTKN